MLRVLLKHPEQLKMLRAQHGHTTGNLFDLNGNRSRRSLKLPLLHWMHFVPEYFPEAESRNSREVLKERAELQ